MDPHTNVTEIWPFFVNRGNGATSDCEYEMRQTHFGQGSGHFVGNAISDASGDESQGWVRQNGGKKRYEVVSAKVVSTSAISVMRNKLLRSSSQKETKEVEIGGASGHAAAENSAKLAEPPRQDYIHVRARRGQATDSHSLAERARREKISERMKILQDLVPGCNKLSLGFAVHHPRLKGVTYSLGKKKTYRYLFWPKVIGKALVLDEIINYIHSLQHQVEFLSMKLEAINSRLPPPGLEVFSSIVFGQQAFDSAGVGYPPQLPRPYGEISYPDWLHMQVGSGFHRS